MTKFFRTIGAFIAAVLVTGVAASVFSTQFVIAGLADVDIHIPFGMRLGMTVSDLPLLQLYAIFASIAFLVAFPIAAVCRRFLPGDRRLWLLIGGAVSIVAGLLLLKAVAGNSPIGGARGPVGLLFQGLAGGIGGWVFFKLTQPRESIE